MRRQMLASFAVLSASAGSAFAAGLPPAPFSWTGCYVGVNAGGDWGRSNWTPTPLFWVVPNATVGADGAIGGGQAGCNYQVQSFVLGAEGEVWGSGLTGHSVVGDFNGRDVLKTKSDFGADVAARVGFAVDRALLFGKVGVAWADYNFSDAFTDFEGRGSAAPGAARYTGLLLGLGVEYAIDAHWSLKGEYDYIDYGSQTVAITDFAYTAKIPISENLLKVGANYRF